MLGLTCAPPKVYQILFPFKPHFRCAQARHFVLICWLLVVLVIDRGKGTLKELSRLLPPRIKYADSTLHLIGDATLKGKRGRKHPVGRTCRVNEYARFCYGFEMVILIASWAHYRVPVAIAVVDPRRKGQQNILFRRMLRQFVPPTWARSIIVEADAGFAATKTFRLLGRLGYGYVFAVARTRKFTDGKRLRDLVQHLPRSQYRRIKTSKPDGRRSDYWVFECRRSLHDLGDVTILSSLLKAWRGALLRARAAAGRSRDAPGKNRRRSTSRRRARTCRPC